MSVIPPQAKAAPALPLSQSAWVVANLEQAIEGWLAMGVGPFFTFLVDLPDALYRGKTTPLCFRVALAQAGEVQIELIQQLSAGPSAYRDVIPEGTSGFHHVCRALGAYDEMLEQLRALGVEVATEAMVGDARFCYIDTRAYTGCMLELVDESAVGTALNALVRDGATNWDGSDPVREVDFASLLATAEAG